MTTKMYVAAETYDSRLNWEENKNRSGIGIVVKSETDSKIALPYQESSKLRLELLGVIEGLKLIDGPIEVVTNRDFLVKKFRDDASLPRTSARVIDLLDEIHSLRVGRRVQFTHNEPPLNYRQINGGLGYWNYQDIKDETRSLEPVERVDHTQVYIKSFRSTWYRDGTFISHIEGKNEALRLSQRIAHISKVELDLTGIVYTLRALLPDKQFTCLLYTSQSPRDRTRSRMPSSA